MKKKFISCLLVATIIATPFRFHNELSSLFTTITAHADVSYSSLMSEAGFDDNDIGSSKQLVFVKSSATTCKVYVFEKTGNEWKQVGDVYSGYVGSDGVGEASESSAKTPKGVFKLGFAFGSVDVTNNTKYEYRKLNNKCYWVSDVNSTYYNRWVDLSASSNGKFWNDDENLYSIAQGGLYKYSIVIEYNMHPVEKGKGSAFFLHCSGNKATAGCVSIPESAMKYLVVEFLDTSKEPLIAIC